MWKETGGAAFPQSGVTNNDGRIFESSEMGGAGMTLRDYFAAKSLAVAWAALEGGYFEADADTSAQKMAECAYQLADAMIEARGQ